jgi:hypothetical protein
MYHSIYGASVYKDQDGEIRAIITIDSTDVHKYPGAQPHHAVQVLKFNTPSNLWVPHGIRIIKPMQSMQ